MAGHFILDVIDCKFYLVVCQIFSIPINILELCSKTQSRYLETIDPLGLNVSVLLGGTRATFGLGLILPYLG